MAAGDDSLDNAGLTIHALNVGQADAITITTQNDGLFLLDADMKAVKEQLDTVVAGRTLPKTADGKIRLGFGVTHIDEDHVDGIDTLSSDYEIQSVAQPDARRFEISDPETGESGGGVG